MQNNSLHVWSLHAVMGTMKFYWLLNSCWVINDFEMVYLSSNGLLTFFKIILKCHKCKTFLIIILFGKWVGKLDLYTYIGPCYALIFNDVIVHNQIKLLFDVL